MVITRTYYEVVCDNCGKVIGTLDYFPNKEDYDTIGAVKTKRHVYCTDNCKMEKMIQSNGNKPILT
jgi:hypothetical protein